MLFTYQLRSDSLCLFTKDPFLETSGLAFSSPPNHRNPSPSNIPIPFTPLSRFKEDFASYDYVYGLDLTCHVWVRGPMFKDRLVSQGQVKVTD